MQITTVLFDLGSTLVYSKLPWAPFYEQADRALVDELQRKGLNIDSESFYLELDGFIRTYYDIPLKNNLEQTAFVALRAFLNRKGFPNTPETTLLSALEALYSITQQNWFLEQDAIPVLEILKSENYQLGIVSNTSDDSNVQRIVDKMGLRSYFEIVVTSAGLGIRKPDARIFQAAMEHMHVEASATAMVGDRLEADILGANNLGMYSIWITRRAEDLAEGELAIQPKAVVSELSQIPALLEEVNHDR